MIPDELYCNCSDLPVLRPQYNPEDAIVVKGKGDIFVDETREVGRTVYTVENRPYEPPKIIGDQNPVRQVGETVSFSWDLSIVEGRETVTSRSITPDPGVDLTAPFQVSVASLKLNDNGFYQVFDIRAIDNNAIETQRLVGINAYDLLYQGYSYKDGESPAQNLVAGDIAGFSSFLNADIKKEFGGEKSYNVPPSGALQYIYWLYPVGTEAINKIELNNLPFPIKVLPGTLTITNPLDGSLSQDYVVVRSQNRFGTGTLKLRMY